MNTMLEPRVRSMNSVRFANRLFIIACALASLCEVATSAPPVVAPANTAKQTPLRVMRVCVGAHHPDCYVLEPSPKAPPSGTWQLRREHQMFVTTTMLKTPAETSLVAEAFSKLEKRLKAEVAVESKATIADLVKRQKAAGACLESVRLEAAGQKMLSVCKKTVVEGPNGLRAFAETLVRFQRAPARLLRAPARQ